MLSSEEAIKHLTGALNIFDVAAVLYEICEENRDEGWRFAAIDEELDNDPTLATVLYDERDRTAARFREVFDNKATSIEQILNQSEPLCGVATNSFRALAGNADSAASKWPTAAWFVLQAIDQSISTKVTALLRRFRDTKVQPLNFNHEVGFWKVFLKMASSFSRIVPDDLKLPEPGKTIPTVSRCLEHLAFTKRHEDILRIESVSALWDDLSVDQVPKCAVVLPTANYGKEFPIRKRRNSRGSSGLFWIEAKESEAYRNQLIRALREADAHGAVIAILPELSSSERAIEAISSDARNNPFATLRIIVAGSYHRECARGSKDNVAVVLDGGGNTLWEHKKHVAYTYEETEERYCTKSASQNSN